MPPVDRLTYWIDWERDGTFDHALSNVTPYVMAANWTLGFQSPYETIGAPCGVTLQLDNRNGDWNPLRAGATFAGVLPARDAMVRVQYEHEYEEGSFTTQYLAVFKIVDISIAPGLGGSRIVLLTGQDWHSDLMGTLYDPPLTLNTSTSAAVEAALINGGMPGYPTTALNFIVGASTLGETTRLPDYDGDHLFSIFDGHSTLDYVGDNMSAEGTSLYAFISEMCLAELGGRFRFEVQEFYGVPCYVFYGRSEIVGSLRMVEDSAVNLSEFVSATYTYGANQCNILDMTLYPRKLGAAGTEIARMSSVLAINGLESRNMSFRYRDPDSPDGSCAAVALIQPVSGSDYTANLKSDGTGENYTSFLSVAVENKTNAAEVTFSNLATGTIYITLFKLRGTPLTARQAITLSGANGPSIGGYGFYRQSMIVNGIDDQELVQSYADWYVATHGEPRASYTSVTFDYTDATPFGLAIYAFSPLTHDALVIQDDWTEDPADLRAYWVAGHSCSVQGGKWSVTLVLEDYAQQGVWTIGDTVTGLDGREIVVGGRLGENTILGF